MLSHPHYFSLQLELHLILGMLNLKKNGNILNLKLKKNILNWIGGRFHSVKSCCGQQLHCSFSWCVVKFQFMVFKAPSHPIHFTGCV